MVTNWLVDDCETVTNGRLVQHIRAHQRHGFRMLERLRVKLSQQRDNGEVFDDVWAPSVAKALRLLDHRGEHRNQWKIALNATQSEWRAAYEGEEADEVVERVTNLERVSGVTHVESDNAQTSRREREGRDLHLQSAPDRRVACFVEQQCPYN